MIKVETKFDFKSLNQMVTNLKYVSSDSFLRSLDIKEEASETLQYLKAIFPRSANNKDLKRFGAHLVDGWKVIPFIGAGIGFMIQNILEKNAAANTILKVIDTGHQAFQYKVKKKVQFFGREYNAKGKLGGEGWITLMPDHYKKIGGQEVFVEGRTVYHSNREGIYYLENTREFILDHMLPRLKEKVISKVASRMKRGYG